MFLGAGSLITSCAVLLLDGVGGHIYAVDKHDTFYIPIASESLVIVLMVILASCRQLHL